MEAKLTTTRTERWNSLKSSSIAWLAGFAARISRITGDAGFCLWLYLTSVVFAAIGIYATQSWLF